MDQLQRLQKAADEKIRSQVNSRTATYSNCCQKASYLHYLEQIQYSRRCLLCNYYNCYKRNFRSGLSHHHHLLTVVERVDGVYHELQEAVSEVAPRVQDWDPGPGAPPSSRLPGHHRPGHGRSGHASLYRVRERRDRDQRAGVIASLEKR